ncbi:MAG: ATP-binding protein [Fibrobacterota bacterium]
MHFRILVADDDACIRDLIVNTLKSSLDNGTEDWCIMTASNGQEALDLHANEPFDFFLMDLNMPGVDGVEILKRLQPRVHDYEIAIISGMQDFAVAQTCLQLGALDYLVKPIALENLIRTAKRAYSRVKEKKEQQDYLLGLKDEVKRKESEIAFLATISETERSRMSVILNTIEEGLLITDIGGWVLLLNRTAETFLGAPVERCIGTYLTHAIALPGFHTALSEIRLFGNEHRATFYTPDNRLVLVREFPILSQGDEPKPIGRMVLMSDITEQEQALMARNNILSIVSHELRTPLTVIKNYLFVLDKAINDPIRGVIANLGTASAQLNEKVDNLVKVALYSDPRTPLTESNVRVNSLMEESMARLGAEVTAKKVCMDYQDKTGGIAIRTDPEKVGIVLDNVLGNAIKFSPMGGTLRVTLELEQQWVVISIADQGQGIPSEHLPNLFKEFRQAEPSLTREHGGLGIGLYVVKKIMEMLSGHIEVASEPGKGSCFRIGLSNKS